MDTLSLGLFIGFITVGAISGAAIIALVIIALVQVAREPRLEPIVKAVWVLIIVVAPVIGSVIWFAIGQATRTDSLHRSS